MTYLHLFTPAQESQDVYMYFESATANMVEDAPSLSCTSFIFKTQEFGVMKNWDYISAK